MRLLRVHAPDADPRVAQAVGDAVRSFNGSLDIRLRFLSIGIEETVVDATDAAAASALPGTAPGAATADLAVVLGGGESAVAAASAALRAGVPVVRVGAGERTGADAGAARALDHLCPVLLAWDAAGAEVLRAEGVRGEVEVVGGRGDPELGERIVRALTRARRRERC